MITRSRYAHFVPVRWPAAAVRCGVALGVLLGGFFGSARSVPAATPGIVAFPALELAAREQAALVVSAGEDPVRWPAAEVQAVAVRWNAAALEASHTRLTAQLLRERWELLVGGTAEAWSRFALVADAPTPAVARTGGAKPVRADQPTATAFTSPTDTMAILAGDARALGDDAAAVLPAIRAAGGGKRAALLLTTSVGCECTMQRAAMMEEVWRALTAEGSGAVDPAATARPAAELRTSGADGTPDSDLRPFLGRSDLVASPDLPDAFALDRVPGWLLLDPGGEIAFRVDGGEGVAEITTMIRRWLAGEDFHR